MYKKEITKAEINLLPIKRFEGKIIIINNPDKVINAVNEIKEEKIIGFDTETKPTFNKGEYNDPALLQLSTEKKAFLFRINNFGLPDPLIKMFENNKITKVGIGIDHDLKDLKKIRDFSGRNFVDLNDYSKKLGFKNVGVRNLSGIFLDSRISKNAQISNWENRTLTNKQMVYAATDAWVCVEIYKRILDIPEEPEESQFIKNFFK